MILGMSIGAFTILHVIITIVAIGSGLIVVGGMFASHRLPITTALFLFTTALTSLTGFLFPIHGFTPALGVGIVATAVLLIALFALFKEHLAGAWRWIYVIAAVASLYLNVFVLVVQSFVKVSALVSDSFKGCAGNCSTVAFCPANRCVSMTIAPPGNSSAS